jgi:hypothetical protein
MPSERRFRNDSTKATRFHKPDDGDHRMNENDEDVVHDGIVSNLQNSQNSGRVCNSPPTGAIPGNTLELECQRSQHMEMCFDATPFK